MDLMAGPAMQQLRKEVTRKLYNRGLFQSTLPKRPPSGHHSIDTEKYAQFMKEELAWRKKRQRRLNRQNLVYVLLGSLLPMLLLVLKFLFF